MPWHYADPFFQERPDVGDVSLDAFFEQADLEELTLRTYDGMGFEIRDIVARSDLYERPGKSQHAFCTDLGRRGDVRVLCNLRPTARWACTNLHEFGHAIYFKHLAADLPFLLRVPAHTNCTEAVAMLMGRLAARPDWLDTINGAHAASKGVTRTALEAQTGLAMLILVRWVLVMALFERDLYSYPDRPNLNALWWDHVERFQLLRRPDGRDAPDWAAKIHLAQAPVYYHNYLLGELIASQLEHTLEGEAVGGFVDNPVAGAFLRERMFALGGRLSWHETVAQVTGEPLTPKYFIDQYVK
jgi:peptidyl-dipeptidase A